MATVTKVVSPPTLRLRPDNLADAGRGNLGAQPGRTVRGLAEPAPGHASYDAGTAHGTLSLVHPGFTRAPGTPRLGYAQAVP